MLFVTNSHPYTHDITREYCYKHIIFILPLFITRKTNKLTCDDDCSVCNTLTIELDQILGIV